MSVRRTMSWWASGQAIGPVRTQRAGAADAGGSGDPDFASVVLLLDFAGADEATDITDLSNSAHVETFFGTAKVDTAVQYLGVNSLECSTGQSYVTYADHADWDFPGDFTVELGLYLPAADSSRGIISTFSASDGWAFQTGDGVSSTVDLNFIINGSQVKGENMTLARQTMHHVAICRDGTDLRIFVNGVQQGTPTTNSTSIAGAEVLSLGILKPTTIQQFALGQIGAVRITKGVARYTANFTPPTEFYPTS